MVDLGEFCCSVAVRGVPLRPTTMGALLTLVVTMADAGSDPGLLPPVILTTLAATKNGFPWGKEVAFFGKDFGSRSTGLDWLTPDCARICTICFRSEFRSDMMNGCKLATWRRLNSPRRLTKFWCDWSIWKFVFQYCAFLDNQPEIYGMWFPTKLVKSAAWKL